jgi:hypothetical protein
MNSEELLKENLLLKEEIGLLKEKLKKYTAPDVSKFRLSPVPIKKKNRKK